MDMLKEFLLAMDTTIPIMLIVAGFIVYEVYSGEVPVRWFGAIHRDSRPFFYWVSILFHLAILGAIIYDYMDGFRLPVSEFFE